MTTTATTITHHIIYKTVKVPMPHCSVCGEKLRGNNSEVSPFRCKCGKWLYNWMSGEYSIKEIKTPFDNYSDEDIAFMTNEKDSLRS